MIRKTPFIAAMAVLAACDESQPFVFASDEVEVVVDEDTPIEDLTIDQALDVGTEVDDEDDDGSIARVEVLDDVGGGYAQDFIYDSDEDTLTVDNLAFDGLNVYTRGANTSPTKLSDLGTVAVYHGDETVTDFLDLDLDPADQRQVQQLVPYVALYDESDVLIVDPIPEDATPEEIAEIQAAARPRTSFSVVRTGDFIDFGFGGFNYTRAGDVVLPTTGQAAFSGDYAGLRVLDEGVEILVTEGDASIEIDFDDFNDGAGLKGRIVGRQAYTADGQVFSTITDPDRLAVLNDAILSGDAVAIAAARDAVQLPDLYFTIRGGGETIKENGEISGAITSYYVDPQNGETTLYEEGLYFGIIAGDTTDAADGGEIAGVIRVESPDSRYIGVTAQETGGFIAKR